MYAPYVAAARQASERVEQAANRLRMLGVPEISTDVENFERTWKQYDQVRDDIMALILVGNRAAALQVISERGQATFDAALEPVRRRMERVKMGEPFVRGLLRAQAVLDPNDVALAWAGMPNKNERAATLEVLDALVEAGFLAHEGEHYRVVRAAPD